AERSGYVVILFSFFFSSRRRHTRWPRDWSSDVCSSDLEFLAALGSQFFRQVGYLFLATTQPGLAELEERRALQTSLGVPVERVEDRKSTRLNSSHVAISYAVFCLKKKRAN